MKRIRKKRLDFFRFGFLPFVVMLLYNCGKSIPIEEMSNAKYLVSKAESVKADEYAPEKYEASKKALFQAHELISKGDMDTAKAKAVEAAKLAEEAFELAIPKLAQSNRDTAETLIEEAEGFAASELAEEEFKNSKDFLAEGDDHVANGGYEDAIESYEDSAQAAGKARDIAEAQVEAMKSLAVELEDTLKQAEKYGAKKKFPDKLARAQALLSDIKDKLSADNFKEAQPALKELEKLAREILSDSLRTWAEDLYKDASAYVSKVESTFSGIKKQINENPASKKSFESDNEKKEVLDSTQTSMDAAKEALVEAKKLLDDSIYQASKDQSEEANRLAKIVQDQFTQLSVLAKESDDRLLSISNEPPEKKSLEPTPPRGWKKYIVKNRPERRDCLWRIAGFKNIYGNPRLWPRIYKANKSQIRNPDLIYPGQVFDIPPKSGPISKKVVVEKAKKEEKADEETRADEETKEEKVLEKDTNKEIVKEEKALEEDTGKEVVEETKKEAVEEAEKEEESNLNTE